MTPEPELSPEQLERYDELRDGADRAIGAIGPRDLETLLATLGMAVTTALLVLPPEERLRAAFRWMRRLAKSLDPELSHQLDDEDEPSVH